MLEQVRGLRVNLERLVIVEQVDVEQLWHMLMQPRTVEFGSRLPLPAARSPDYLGNTSLHPRDWFAKFRTVSRPSRPSSGSPTRTSGG